MSQCSNARAQKNTLSALKIALRSQQLLAQLQEQVPLEFSHLRAGKLVLLSSREQLEAAHSSSELKMELGCRTEVLTLDEAIAIEPAIAEMAANYIGAQYSVADEVGDAHAFTVQLARWLQLQRGVEVALDTEILGIRLSRNRVSGVETRNGVLPAQAVVVCLGAWSAKLLAPLGIKTGIYPVRGYSVTLQHGPAVAEVSLTDLEHKIVFSRLGDQVRVAGFTDFVGFNTTADPGRIDRLLRTARTIAPQLADYQTASSCNWGGFRPMRPDNTPLVGPSKLPGLYMNTGHGMLGWTMACSTGSDVANSVSNGQSGA